MNAQLLFDALSPRVLRCWLLLASLLIGSGCDWLALPICQLDPMTTGCPDGGVTRDLSAVNPDSPLGPLRKFEWRAKITNDEKQKFVGILRSQYAVMLLSTPMVSFSAVAFDLNQDLEPNRLKQVACPADICPQVKNIKPASDSVYLTNEAAPAFWLLRQIPGAYDSYRINRNGDLTGVDKNAFAWKGISQPFFHPILDACLIPTQNVLSKYDILHLTVGAKVYNNEHVQNGTVTAVMIGDIDATDLPKNGVEVVRFGSASVASVYHYDPEDGITQEDAYLQKALKREVDKQNMTGNETIGAAYVNDLNRDKSLDFVFSLGVNAFVSSYKGRDSKTGLPVFEAWPKSVLGVPAIEKIQSIMAIDITNDLYPDLIVVTDKSVHFYLNTPL